MLMHKAYFIETLTNTSVGSGDVSFGLVDSLIQKDPNTFLPVFHSSSVKGSLKEHMENNNLPKDLIKTIFGEGKDNPGQVKFYDARLLTLPLRASKKVYYNCTSPSTIADYLEALETFCSNTEVGELKKFVNGLNFDGKDFIVFNGEEGLEIEDYEEPKVEVIRDASKKELLKRYLGVEAENTAIFRDKVFKDICESSLPVIARNKIGEVGTSENLFYEEVLPRRSRLWFMLGFEGVLDTQFEEKLTSDLIQFGANYSIGYGVTKISLIQPAASQPDTNKEVADEPKKD